MEGLIPLVYRAIKKNRTRRQYEYLSSGNSSNHVPVQQGYNIADFFVTDHHHHQPQINDGMMMKSGNNYHHRRHNSVGSEQFHHGFGSLGGEGDRAPKRSRSSLVRFKSHRMFTFSCVTGAA
ncbi:hypothetical protein CsatB_022957 [Cannabis sativa]|uniref:Uncharacterized protein n=1 Tax=Cannabis sativa TaxID=3483 RepID=A0A803PBG0_CANSA